MADHHRPDPCRVLLIAENEKEYRRIRRGLPAGYRLEWVSTVSGALEALAENGHDAVLLENGLAMRDLRAGPVFLDPARADGRGWPLILFAGEGSPEIGADTRAVADLCLDQNELPFLEKGLRLAIELKQKEKARLQQLTDFQQKRQWNTEILDSIQDGIFGLDDTWCFSFINHKGAANVGYAPADLVGKNIWEVFPSILGTTHETCYRQVMAERHPASFEMKGVLTQQWYNIRVFPFSGGIIVYWIDISAQKRSEAALLESDMRFRTVWEITTDALSLSDSQGTVLAVNPAYCRLFGYSEEEIVGQDFATLLPEAARDIARQQYLEIFASPALPPSYEANIQRKDGEPRIVESRVAFVNQEGQRKLMLSIIRDITESRQAETERERMSRALTESEERLRVLMETTPDLVWSALPDGNADYLNSAWQAYTGLTLEELNRSGWDIINHPDEAGWLALAWGEAYEKGEAFDIESRIRKHDGTYGWFWGRSAPVKDAQGNIIKWVGVNRDITERRMTEEALLKSEAQLKERNEALEKAHAELVNERSRLLAVMEAMPIGLAILDDQGRQTQSNPDFEVIWGGPRPPVSSMDDLKLYSAWWVETGQPVKPEEWASTCAVRNGETVTGQFIQIQRFDGSRAFVLNSAAPIRDAQGKINGCAVTIMDITDWIEAENALRDSQERFRVALTSVPLLVYTCDREQRYTWVYNPLRGFKASDVLGKRDDEILGSERAAELVAAKQQALGTGRGSVQEVKVPFDGQNTYYLLTTEPVKDLLGNVTGLTCSAIDITAQKLLEIEQRERAMQIEVQRRLSEQREQERQQIARDIHDGPIQTLVSTLFNVQIAKDAVTDPLAQMEFGQIGLSLQDTVRELRDVVNELRPPSLIRFGLGKAIKMYLEDFNEKHAELEIHADIAQDERDLPENVRLALFRICQEALTNIVRHASASKIWLRFAAAGSAALLEVRDNGQGIANVANLADQTYRGHFGMAGMKERAEAVGGALTITSSVGQGTTVRVTVPIR